MLVECALVLALLGLVVTLQLTLAGAFPLFRRLFWTDEIITYTLVTDPSLTHSLKALVSGLEINPPAYHLLLRPLRPLIRDAGEVTLRGLALLAVLAALTGLYVNLRQVFPPFVAFTAVLAVWVHPLVLEHAFEARMYGAWLAAVVWFTYLLGRCWQPEAEWWLLALLAATSLMACLLSTMGAAAVGVAVFFHVVVHDPAGWRWPVLAAACIGPAASLAWVPFFYRQNEAWSVNWITPLSADAVYSFLATLFLPSHLAALLMLAGLWPFLPGVGEGAGAAWVLPPGSSALAGLVGLFFLPWLLIGISCLYQPLTNDRYALPAVACVAPAVAAVAAPLPVAALLVLCVLLAALGALKLKDLCVQFQMRDGRSYQLLNAIRDHTEGKPVLFEAPDELYVVCRYAPDVAARCHGLDFEREDLSSVDAMRLAWRDQMRFFAQFYPDPGLIPWKEARDLPVKYLVPFADPAGVRMDDLAKRYPGFVARPVGEGLYELVAPGV